MDDAISGFVQAKHMAVVGVSDRKFGGAIYKSLKKKGYVVYPVHPTRESFDGDACFSGLGSLPAEVAAAVVAVSPETAMSVVDEASSSGIRRLWFQQGKDFSEAAAKAEGLGLSTVTGKCILMYAEPVTGIHAFHRFLVRLFGRL